MRSSPALLFAIATLTISCGATPPPAPAPPGQITFVAAGDVIPHGPVVQAATAHKLPGNDDGWDALFAPTADLFRSADFGFLNLETPVAPKHSTGTGAFKFNAPIALVDALLHSGIKIVSFANNHVMDQNWSGFTETRQHLKDEGMLFIGTSDTAATAWQPVIVEKNGLRIGFLGITRWLNGNRNPDKPDQPHVNFFPYPDPKENLGATGIDEPGLIAAVKSARAQCDFLILSIHWGTEYATAPRPEDVAIAHHLLDAGAGLLIGHHPHVLQRIENYTTTDGRPTVIFYSLGNFLSNQSRTFIDGKSPAKEGDPRQSLIIRFSVVEENDAQPSGATQNDHAIPAKHAVLENVGIYPAWEINNRNQISSGKEKIPDIHPALLDREIATINTQIAPLTAKPPDTLTPEEKKSLATLNDQLRTCQHQRALILTRLGPAAEKLLTPPPTNAPQH